jgi:hypothetical protein
MVLFLEITAFILTGLCVVHSVTCRGREFTVLFFLGGFLLVIIPLHLAFLAAVRQMIRLAVA